MTLIGTFGAIGNGFSRFLWSVLFNKTGYKFVMLLNIFLCIIVLGTIRFAVSMNPLYLFLVFVMNCCLGGYLVITPTFSQLVFGQETGSNVYGFYWCTYSLANFLQFSFVSSLNNSIGFENVIYICMGMCVLSIPMVITNTWQGPWKNSLDSLEYIRPPFHGNRVANESENEFEIDHPTISAELMLRSNITSDAVTEKSYVKFKTQKENSHQ